MRAISHSRKGPPHPASMESLPSRLMTFNLLCHFILPSASDHQPVERVSQVFSFE